MKTYVLMLVMLLCTLRVQAQTFTHQVQKPLDDSIEMQQRSQQELDTWEREKAEFLRQYEELLRRQAAAEEHNVRLEQQLATLAQAIQKSKQAVLQARELEQEMEPFLHESVQLLDAVVQQSLPFNLVERHARLQQLQQDLLTGEVSVAQQFRHLLQALKAEYDYGHSVEVERTEQEVEGELVVMTQVRIGALALFALSLDQQRSAIYDVNTQRWVWLDTRWCEELRRAVAMGNKQRPVDLLTLPFGRLVEP
ncbi:MAG: DUF3450 domain-containing protein [Desulfuromonadaceae bacterium]|nr:DUF3450 domain-containing protein [Desulfuromonadaceae bacterium]